jgi:hypothetical protein
MSMSGFIAGIHKQTIGQWMQVGGAIAFGVGALLCLHHAAIAICFAAGAGAFYAGRKLRSA